MTPIITSASQLEEQIQLLTLKKKAQEVALKESFKENIDKLKPVNLFKTAWNQISTSPEIKDNIIDNSIGLAAGFASKKILIGNTHNPVKRLLGAVAQYGVTNIVANHADPIKTIGLKLFNMIINRRKNKRAV